MPDPAWRCVLADSGEGLGRRLGAFPPSVRRFFEFGVSVLRVLFEFLQFSVELRSSLRVLGNVHSTWLVCVGSLVSEPKIFKIISSFLFFLLFCFFPFP